jgi:hypothetical protein
LTREWREGSSFVNGIRTESGLEFVVAAVLIFLALVAAVGAWRGKNGLARQDAEDLLEGAQERQLTELESVKHSLQQLEDRLSQAATFQDEKLGRSINELQVGLNATLAQIQAGVENASLELKNSMLELSRQQNEAKAQSAIQMCDALITSLGSVRNSIAAQIAEPRAAEMISEQKTEGTKDRAVDEEEKPLKLPPKLPPEAEPDRAIASEPAGETSVSGTDEDVAGTGHA